MHNQVIMANAAALVVVVVMVDLHLFPRTSSGCKEWRHFLPTTTHVVASVATLPSASSRATTVAPPLKSAEECSQRTAALCVRYGFRGDLWGEGGKVLQRRVT